MTSVTESVQNTMSHEEIIHCLFLKKNQIVCDVVDEENYNTGDGIYRLLLT